MTSVMLGEYEKQKNLLSDKIIRNEEIYNIKAADVPQKLLSAKNDMVLLDHLLEMMNERNNISSKRLEAMLKLSQAGHISNVELETFKQQYMILVGEQESLKREILNRKNLIQQLKNDEALIPKDCF